MNGSMIREVKATYDLLKRGEKEIELKDTYKNVVLLLGITGAGKTTFTQWIAGDNDKLISKEVAEGTGEFIIHDNNKIADSTIKSKTIFPGLVIDNTTNTAYYDCPGFSDTRSTSNDIATTYFIKKVLDHAEKVKMIFLISYPAVRKGVDREAFMRLIKHSTDLVKDINKFQSSIAIVVTKVDNQYVKQGKNVILVDDKKVIGAIADFFQEVKQDLEKELKLSNISFEQENFYQKAIKFIDVLLIKDNNYYTKIGIFRRPDESGPLSNITLLQDGKVHIKKIFSEKLNFSEKNVDDFGYTLSEKSKNDITDIVEEVDKNIQLSVDNIAKEVHEFYQNLVDQMRNNIKSILRGGSATDHINVNEAKIFSTKLNSGLNVMSSLTEKFTNLLNPEELSEIIKANFARLDINLSENNMSDLKSQGKYLNFLQTVSDKKFNLISFKDFFKGTLQYLSESRKAIVNDVNYTAHELNKHLNDISKVLQRHFNEKIKLTEIQKLPAELKKDLDMVSKIITKTENATVSEIKEAKKTANDVFNDLGISINKNDIPLIVYTKEYFNFLQIVCDQESNFKELTWISPLSEVVENLRKSDNWYRFLNNLFSKFSEYKIQKDKISHVHNLNLEYRSEKRELNEQNIKQFLDKLVDYNILGYNDIKSMQLTALQLYELNHILNLTLKSRIEISCTEPFLLIKGHFISIKDIVTRINNEHYVGIDIDYKCMNLITKNFLKSKEKFSVSENFKFINVFALNTVFIDESMTLDARLRLTVIAPKWEIIGRQYVDLKGNPGKSYLTRASPETDGQSGGVGRSGGNFFGIGNEFINDQNLIINVNGGDGGKAQDGGDGRDGETGRTPDVPDDVFSNFIYIYDCSQCDYGERVKGFECKKIQHFLFEDYCEKIFGTRGKKGRDGGNGGKGGYGGNPGNIILIDLNSNSEISNLNIETFNDTGSAGADGIGGIGGYGGTHGNDIVACCKKWSYGWFLTDTIWNRGRASHGSHGTSGVGSFMEIATPAISFDKLDQAKIINKYKNYLRENINNRFDKYYLNELFKKLETNQQVINVYDTLGLLDELTGLEEQFHTLNQDWLPFYKSLLDRVGEYSRNLEKVEDLNQHKIVLSYLYTAIFGRLYSLQVSFESNLIIDTSAYLMSTRKDIYTLIDLKNANNKVNLINKYTKEYKKVINAKMEEVQNYVQKEIRPEIESIGFKIDRTLKSLITDIELLQKSTVENINEFKAKKEELKDELILNSLFTGIKAFSQIISFLEPFRNVFYTASDTDSLLLNNVSEQLSRIQSFRYPKVTQLKSTLDYILLGITENPVELGNMSVTITDIKMKLNESDKKSLDAVELKVLKNDIKTTLQLQETELLKNPYKNTTNALLKINNYKEALKFTGGMFAIYNKYRNNKSQLDTINEIITMEEDTFLKLEEYEENIDGFLEPILQYIINDLAGEARQTITRSKVALDMYKRQVKNSLKGIKSQIQELSKEFQVKNNFLHLITKIEDAIMILINVNNHIKEYRDHEEYAGLIADISSITADDINVIADPKLGNEFKNAVRDLERLIWSEIIIQRYQVAIDAFKMFVFPLAHNYIKNIKVPSYLQSVGNYKSITSFDALVHEVSQQIDMIKLKLDDYVLSLSAENQQTGQGDFGGPYRLKFFVWENAKYRNEISKLLTGQEIILKADIMNSLHDLDAVKFNIIQLYFKSNNKTLQTKLNYLLEKEFEISMTHLGNSYYRYDKKIYPITTKSLEIWYSFEKKLNSDEPNHKGNVYNKLKNGNFMLSPYALWKIQLKSLTNNENFSFRDLKIFEDKIDLELGGHAFYARKEKINEDLMIDDYYETIDNDQDLFSSVHSDDNDGDLTPKLQDTVSSIRSERDVSNKLENQNRNSTNVADTNHNSRVREKRKTGSGGWFSWIKLPTFNFLPAAEAVHLEGENLSCGNAHDNYDSFTISLKKTMKSLKDVVFYKILKLSDDKSDNGISENIPNNNAYYTSKERTLNNPAISFDSSKSNYNVQEITSIHVNSSLILGQLIVRKIFGENKSLRSHTYVSPEQEKYIRIDKLASEILPIKRKISIAEYAVDFSMNNFNDFPQWYQDIYKNEFEEMMNKRCHRNQKKNRFENLSEDIFADGIRNLMKE